MKIGALLSAFIYLVSSSLLYPVLFLLSVLTLWCILEIGRFFGDWLTRKKYEKTLIIRRDNYSTNITTSSHYVVSFYNSLENIISSHGQDQEAQIAYLLYSKEQELEKSLDWLRTVVRIGPTLGLMGTLIPMGTGLAALSQGDIGRLSSDLVIAFTTTVVGLGQAGLTYVIHSIRKRWVERDCLQMEYIAELAKAPQTEKGDKNNDVSAEAIKSDRRASAGI
ncbi:MAG: MotA/TolQ/ExbB proton channel family protein [Deltaproteobacteria bacterium]|nr:MotA/TolQ/ExbB proton channel family protein [Deltaproteobacteria bacterium]MBW2068699.1 MotA/TolQ/ExbB proton channel family protein [Deltaproteobacteria bacterium]